MMNGTLLATTAAAIQVASTATDTGLYILIVEDERVVREPWRNT